MSKMKKSFAKMDKQELETWLHLNRKAHAVKSKKVYDRKREKRNERKGDE